MYPINSGSAAVSVGAANGAGNSDPKRAIPQGMDHLSFLMQIGRENPNAPEELPDSERPADFNWRTYIDPKDSEAVEEALRLGDIVDSGLHTRNGFTVYKFAVSPSGFNDVLFSLDPLNRDAVGASDPPWISHAVGDIHGDMGSALWAVWCYENPQSRGSLESYENIMRGINARYHNITE